MPWNPTQYDRFKRERSAPVDDLFSRLVVKTSLNVIDLGCGTGEITRRLCDALSMSTVLGIDNSAEMLEKSTAFSNERCSFRLEEIVNIEGTYDLIFSNAALQWCADHPHLFELLWQHLKPGGQLLVQMPKNQDHVSHRMAGHIAHELFPHVFPSSAGDRKGWVLEIEDYAALLFSLGAENIDVVQKIYPHILNDSDEVVEWVKGTLLVPIMEQLDEQERETFLNEYSKRLHQEIPESPTFYGFKRMLISATKPT